MSVLIRKAPRLDFIDPRYFGGDPSGTRDSSTAIRLACLQAAETTGRRRVVLGPGTWKVFSDGSTDPLGDWTGVHGLELDMQGKLLIDRTFTGSQVVPVFKFTGCDNVSLPRTWVEGSQTQPSGQRTSRGAEVFLFGGGCTGVRAGVNKAKNVRKLWSFMRAVGAPATDICRGINLGVTYALQVGYPCFASLSAWNMKAQLVTDACGRSYFVTGGRAHKVALLSRNHEASVDALIATDDGDGMDGCDLTYTDTESTTADNSINAVRVEFQFSEVKPGVHRNIRVHLNIKTGASTYQGFGFATGKVKSDGTADTVDRGHILENIKVSGSIVAGNILQRNVGIGSGGTWGAGEHVRNVNLEDLSLRGTGQMSIRLESLKDTASLRNVVSDSQVNLYGNTTSKITCENVVSGGSLTETTADTSLVDYINCTIGDAANQSRINKNFVNTTIAGTLYRTNATQFRAYLAGPDVALTDATFTKVPLSAESFDLGGNFDASVNNRFTAPLAGRYHFTGHVAVSTSLASTDEVVALLYVNGSAVSRGQALFGSIGVAAVSDTLQLAAGDTVELYVWANQAAGSSGHLILADQDRTFLTGFAV